MAPKKPSALDSLLNPGRSAREVWKKDRDRRVAVSDKEAALGRPSVDRMTLSYDNKKFNEQKRSTHKNITKDWERSELKDLPKAYGKSMDKKFTKWANEQGVPEQDHFKFRKWMDSNEYTVKGKNGAKDTPLRSSGYKTVADRQAENVASAEKRSNTEKVRAAEKKKLQKEQKIVAAKKEEKAVKSAKLNANTFGFLGKAEKGADKTFVDKLLGKLPSAEQRTGAGQRDGKAGIHGIKMPEKGRFAAQVENSQFAGMAENTLRAELKANPDAEKQAKYDELYGQAEGGGQKAKDLLAQALGYAGPGVVGSLGIRAGAKALGKEMGKGSLKKKAAELSAEGALIGAGIGSSEIGVREALNPEDTNWKGNLTHLGLNVGAGAVLDPLIGLAAPLAKGASQRLIQGAVDGQGAQAAGQMDALGQVLRNQGVRPLTEGPSPQRVNQQIPQFRSETAPMGDPFTQIVQTAPTQPNPLTSLVGRPQAPKRATMPQSSAKPPVDAPFESKLAYFRNKKNPITEQDLPEIHSKMQEIHTNISRFEENMPQLREVEFQKTPKLKERMDALNEQAKVHVDAKDEWAATKEIQSLYTVKNTRPEWMNIDVGHFRNMPDEFKGIPTRFRYKQNAAASPNMNHKFAKGYDPYYAMEQAGFDNMEEFIGHLQNIDAQLRVKLKDVQTVSGTEATLSTKQLQKLESELDKHIMKSYGMTEQEDMLKELIQFSRPREGAAPTIKKTLTTKRSALDDVIGRKVATSTEVFPDANATGVVAGRIDDYATSPIANPANSTSAQGKRTTMREAFDSRIQPAKKLEKDISKRHKAELEEAGVNVLTRGKGGILTRKGSVAKGNAIAFADSPVKQIQGLTRSGSKATRSFEKDMAPINKEMKKYNIKQVNAGDYIIAKHAKDIYTGELDKLNRLGEVKSELEAIEASRVNNTDPGMRKALDDAEVTLLKEKDDLAPYELPEKASEEWVDSILKRFDDHEGYQNIQKMYVDAQKKNPAILRDNGILTDNAVEAMYAKHPNYVSLARDIPKVKGKKIKTTVSGRNPIMARKTGSKDLLIQDPFVSALKNRNAAISAVDRNNAVKAVAKMTKVKGLDEIFQEINPNTPGFKLSSHDDIIEGVVSGEKRYYRVPEVLKNAFDNPGTKTFDNIGAKIAMGMSDIFRKTTTNWNVGFHLWSGSRDSLNALANSRTGANAVDITHGFLDSFMGPQLAKMTGGRFKSFREMYHDQGADMGGFISQDVNAINKKVKAVANGEQNPLGKALKSPIRAIEMFGMKMEHGPRLGEVRSAKRQGYTDEDAVFEAVDLIDYSDQGSATRVINPFDPYLSATIRGNMRTLQAAKNNPKQFIGIGLSSVTLPTLALYGMRYAPTTNDVQRDKINNMQEYQKNTTWAVPIPNSDEVKFIPKGFLLGQVFANPIERTFDKMFLDKDKTNTKIVQETLLDMATSLMPPDQVIGYTTWVELLANKNLFTKMPIESEAEQKKPKSERYSAYTSEVSKKIAQNPIGKFLNVSPAQVDHALKKHTGTLGKQTLDALDNALAIGGDRPSKTQTTSDIVNPLTRFDYKETASSGLYKRIHDAAEQDKAEWKANNPGERRPKGYTRTKNEAIAEEWDEIQKEITSITNDLDYSPKQKYERIGELRKGQRSLGTKFLKN